MKKFYTFIVLLLISGIIHAQFQLARNNNIAFRKELRLVDYITPISSKAVVDSLNYDGVNYTGIGTNTSASSFGVYAYFPAATLASHAASNHKILSVKVYISAITTVTSSQLRFYTDTLTSAMVYSQNFTPVVGWNNVVLTTPFTVPSTGNLYIGYYMVTTGGYPAGCDAGPVNPNGNWIHLGSWTHLNNLSPTLTYNWNIRALCGAVPATPTAICTPLAWNAGNVNVATSATSGTFTLSNSGGGTLTCSGITGLSAPFTTTLIPASVNLTTGQTKTFTFSYYPTVIGANNQTITIATNGGNITISLSGAGVSCAAMTTYPWIESFEGTGFPPACWVKSSPDGGTGWASIIAGTTPLPGWTGGTMTVPTGGGTNAAYCTYTTGGTTANNQWLKSPQIAVPVNAMLTFSMFWFGSYRDWVDVKLSTTTNAEASFVVNLLTIDTLQLIHGAWKQFYVPLNAYAGQNVYLAFREYCADNLNDGAFIGLDMIRIDITTSMEQEDNNLVSVYPNPTNDKLYITVDGNILVDLYNVTGEKVASYANQKVIDVSDLSKGLYIVKVITRTDTFTKKIQIVH